MLLLLSLVWPGQLAAQTQTAQIQGQVVDADTGQALIGATVVVSGPSLGAEQVEVTDRNGRCLITQLPPGDDYSVSIYYGAQETPRKVQSGIRLSLGKTLTVGFKISTRSDQREVKVVRERAPNIDTAGSVIGVEVNQELLRGTPMRGRTYESAIALAPGAADVSPRTFGGGGNLPGGEVGVSIAGATGAENSILIDGINTTDPSNGTLGTELSQYFLREINVLTGGYQAEYGRANGGVVSLATKSGSNELHGGIYGTFQPIQASPNGVARLGEALITRLRDNQNMFDVAFDLGGALMKDRIWFYVGFATTSQYQNIDRGVRQQIYDPTTNGAQRLSDFSCPTYLSNPSLCSGLQSAAAATQEVDGLSTRLTAVRRLYNGIAKLQFNIHPDHTLTLMYLASPATLDSYYDTHAVDPASVAFSRFDSIHDATARYLGKLFHHKLQIELSYGFHYQRLTTTPAEPNVAQFIYNATSDNPYSLADFENVPGCQRVTESNGTVFNPCPMTTYRRGLGFHRDQLLMRHQAVAAATVFANLLGLHAIKLGFDFEYLINDTTREFSGPDYDPNDPTSGRRGYQTDASGQLVQILFQHAQRAADGSPIFANNFHGTNVGRSYAAYLRDSWAVGPIPGLVINAGLRWEAQELLASDGTRAIGIYDNIAPRVGIAYDFTQLTDRPGRGKIFANYARFYQSIPLDVADRVFTGEGVYGTPPSATCPTEPMQPGGRPLPTIGAACNFAPGFVQGGTYGQVAPGLKGQYTNEVVLGMTYDFGLDFVGGISYVHRDLGNIIEDMAADAQNFFFFIGNPGVAPDPGLVTQLRNDVAQAQQRASAPGASAADQQALFNAQGRLSGYLAAGTVFPRPTRDYNALVLTLNKRLSNRFSLLGSYTFSRTIGNYPGLYSQTTGQLNPNNSSQFDFTDLLANRSGPLPADRPHNFKLTGFYDQPIGERSKLSFGLTFTAISGRPIEVLGAHPFYGPNEVFILPRGSGGRTPTVTQFDLHVGFDHKFGRNIGLGLFADVINLFNQQAITNVDDTYTLSTVAVIANGKVSDLRYLRDLNGGPVIPNSNYGQPTAFQAPLYLRLGARMTF